MKTKVIVENLDERFIKRIKEVEKLTKDFSSECKEVFKERKLCDSKRIELWWDLKKRYGLENACGFKYIPQKKQIISFSGVVLIEIVDDDFAVRLEEHDKLERRTELDVKLIKEKQEVIKAKHYNIIHDIKVFYKIEKLKGFLSYDLGKKQILITENAKEDLREMII